MSWLHELTRRIDDIFTSFSDFCLAALPPEGDDATSGIDFDFWAPQNANWDRDEQYLGLVPWWM